MKEEFPQFLNLQLEAANTQTGSDRLSELTRISIELARLVAKNPSTSPELLQTLADSSDATTRQNVVANPNTPPEVLLKIGAEFPEQLLNNPLFSSLLLKDFNLLEQIPASTLSSLLKCEAANTQTNSDRLYELASLSTALARIVVKNPSSSPELLRELSAKQDIKTRLYVTANPNTPKNILLKLGRSFPEQLLRNPIFSLLLLENPHLLLDLLNEMPLNTLQDLLKLEGMPGYVLEAFATHPDVWVRAAVALNSNTPISVIEELARNEDVVRQSVANNPNAPKMILKQLAQDKNWFVRQAVASNPNTSMNTLEKLSWDAHWHIRVAVASNPNTPTRILESFRWDNDRGMCQALAQNPHTPAKILEQLALTQDVDIRREVAKNQSTPVSVLEQLVRDNDFFVCFFRRNPSFKH